MPQPSVVTAVLLGALLGACGGDAEPDATPDAGDTDDTGGTTGEAASESYLAWRSQANRASCQRRLRCESPPPYDSVEACLDDFDGDVLAAAPRIADSIASGRTAFFAEHAEPCLEKYEQPCDAPYTDILVVCNRVYTGLRAQGDDCVGHFECGDGAERLLCFDGCEALLGYEDELGSGVCVADAPDCQ